MAALAQTSQPQAVKQHQHMVILKQAGLKHSNKATPDWLFQTGRITAVSRLQLTALLKLYELTQTQLEGEQICMSLIIGISY